MTKLKCKFTAKDKRDIKSWAKKHGALFTMKEYNKMLRRVCILVSWLIRMII